MDSSSWQRKILQLDADIKDPLTVLKLTAEECKLETRKHFYCQKKLNLILRQVERIIALLKQSTDSVQKGVRK